MDIRLRDVSSAWNSLPELTKQRLLQLSPVAGVLDSLAWARLCTKTEDEQDLDSPYKPLPDWPYFDYLHQSFLAEPILFVPKSRTVMATWWAVIECFHYVMTHQPASCIFWCPDEDRAEKCIDYCKVFYSQQHPELKDLYPLPRKKQRVDEYAGYNDIIQAMVSDTYGWGGGDTKKPRFTIMRGCGDDHLLIKQFKTLQYKDLRGISAEEKDFPREPLGKDRHLIDCVSYCFLNGLSFVPPGRGGSSWEPIYPAIGY